MTFQRGCALAALLISLASGLFAPPLVARFAWKLFGFWVAMNLYLMWAEKPRPGDRLRAWKEKLKP